MGVLIAIVLIVLEAQLLGEGLSDDLKKPSLPTSEQLVAAEHVSSTLLQTVAEQPVVKICLQPGKNEQIKCTLFYQ